MFGAVLPRPGLTAKPVYLFAGTSGRFLAGRLLAGRFSL
jgi:hypothetical protein